MEGLTKGQLVRLRLAGTDDEWVPGVVVVASNTNPQSVGLRVEGLVRAQSGGFVGGGLAVTVDYTRETVTSLIGDEYEVEVADAG